MNQALVQILDLFLPLLITFLVGSGEWNAQARQVVERINLFRAAFADKMGWLERHDMTAFSRDMHDQMQRALAGVIGLALLVAWVAQGNCGSANMPIWFKLLPLLGFLPLIPGRLLIRKHAKIRPIPFHLVDGRGGDARLFRDFTAPQRAAEIAALHLRSDTDIDADPAYNRAAAITDPVEKARVQAEDDAAKRTERESNRRLETALTLRAPFRPLLTSDQLEAQLRAVGAPEAVDASPWRHLIAFILEPFQVSLLLLTYALFMATFYGYRMTGVSLAFPLVLWLLALAGAVLAFLAERLVVDGGTRIAQTVATLPARPLNTLFHAIVALPAPIITLENAGAYVGNYTGQSFVEFHAFVKEAARRPVTAIAVFYLACVLPPHLFTALVALMIGAAVAIAYRNLETADVATKERRKKGAERFELFVVIALAVELICVGLALFAHSWFGQVIEFLLRQLNIMLHFGHVDSYASTEQYGEAKNIFWRGIQVAITAGLMIVIGVLAFKKDRGAVVRWIGGIALFYGFVFILNTIHVVPNISPENLGVRKIFACPADLEAQRRAELAAARTSTPLPVTTTPAVVVAPAPPPSVTYPVPYAVGAPSANRMRHRRRRHHDADGTVLAVGVESGPPSTEGTVSCWRIAAEQRANAVIAGSCHY